MLSAVDAISLCIEELQPEKLRKIFYHNLMLKNADKEKYKHVNKKIKRLKIDEARPYSFLQPNDNLHNYSLEPYVSCLELLPGLAAYFGL